MIAGSLSAAISLFGSLELSTILCRYFRKQFTGAGGRLTAQQKRERRQQRLKDRQQATDPLQQLQKQLQLQERLGTVQEINWDKFPGAKMLYDVLLYVYSRECHVTVCAPTCNTHDNQLTFFMFQAPRVGVKDSRTLVWPLDVGLRTSALQGGPSSWF